MYEADIILHLKKIHEAIAASSEGSSQQTKELFENLIESLKEQTDTLEQSQTGAATSICDSIRNHEQTINEKFDALKKEITDLKSTLDSIKANLDTIVSRTPTQSQLAKMHLYSNIVDKYREAGSTDRTSWQSTVNSIVSLCAT